LRGVEVTDNLFAGVRVNSLSRLTQG
jgi:hypothetical protein